MFDNLLNLVKEHAGDAIINNPAIPNEKNDEAIKTTTNSIVDTLKSQVSSGNLNSLMDLFNKGNVTSSSVSSSVQNNVVNELMKKFGVDNVQASSIAQNIIPTVMEKLVSKTNDPNDKSFDVKDIMSTLGGNTGGLGGMINNFFK